jgi:hypothetical protein
MPSPFFFCSVWSCHLVTALVRSLGGSFAFFGYSVGLCEIANVPPNALALVF